MEALWALGGVILGSIVAGFAIRAVYAARGESDARRAAEAEARLGTIEQEREALRAERDEARDLFARAETALKEREASHEERLAAYRKAEEELKETFKAIGADALKESREEFVKTAESILDKHVQGAEKDLELRQEQIKALVRPLAEQLDKYETHLRELQKEHSAKSQATAEGLKQLYAELDKQRSATTDLKGMLRGPTHRGQIGELMLRVVLERVGLEEGQHYFMQPTHETEDGRVRPDCEILMPNSRRIAVDVKTPLNAYEDSLSIEDETARTAKLDEHARNVKKHIEDLVKRDYRKAVDSQFTVMYLPIEASLSVALQRDPDIQMYALEKNVIIAGPGMLYALVCGLAHAWRQETLLQNVQEIKKESESLVNRIRLVADAVSKMGKALGQSTEHFNKLVTRLESQLLPTAVRLKKLGVQGDAEIPRSAVIDVTMAEFNKPVLSAPLTQAELSLQSEDADLAEVLEPEA